VDVLPGYRWLKRLKSATNRRERQNSGDFHAMSNPDQPDQPKKGRFQPGHKLSKGRKPGAIGRKTLRDKLLNGLARSGEKKALKAGINGKIDGFEYFCRELSRHE